MRWAKSVPRGGRRLRVRRVPLLAWSMLFTCCALLLVSDGNGVKYFETGVGELLPVALSDGSRISINTDSSVTMYSDGVTLYVQISRGEALFNLRPNPRRHLVVSVGGLDIVDRGTIFGVRVVEDGSVTVTVTVEAGRVQLSAGRGVGAWVQQNQQATVGYQGASSGISLRKVAPEDIQRQLSWVGGELVFRDERLAEAVGEINRYNLTQVEVMDGAVGEKRIGGSFSTTDPFAFAKSITTLYPGIRFACEKGARGVLVLRLYGAQAQHGVGAERSGCVSVTIPGS